MKPYTERTNNAGFSLVEVLFASTILVVVLGMFYGIYFSGCDVWESSRLRADLQAETRNAIKGMAWELRGATRSSTQNPSPNLLIPAVPNNIQIDFCLPVDNDGNGVITDAGGAIEWDTDNTIVYRLIPASGRLVREAQGVERIIAQDVEDVRFIDTTMDPTLSARELKILVAVRKTTAKARVISFTLSSMVRMRN